MPRLRLIAFGCLLLAGALGPSRAGKDTAKAPRFDEDVLPILRAKCVSCHGPKNRQADLDLSSAAAVLKGGDSGPAVVPGKPGKSLLYERVHAGEMPPTKKDRLSEAEVETLRRWIADG